MSWEHQLDVQKWMGDRTHDDANQPEYSTQKVISFVYDFTSYTGRLPQVGDILDGLGYPKSFSEKVRITLSNYDHEEEVEFRENGLPVR